MHTHPLLLFLCAASAAATSIPSPPLFFTQLVDHYSNSNATYEQRYYENATSFEGPGTGAPIICILGGEGGIARELFF